MNRASLSVNGGSLEITLTVPLKISIFLLFEKDLCFIWICTNINISMQNTANKISSYILVLIKLFNLSQLFNWYIKGTLKRNLLWPLKVTKSFSFTSLIFAPTASLNNVIVKTGFPKKCAFLREKVYL